MKLKKPSKTLFFLILILILNVVTLGVVFATFYSLQVYNTMTVKPMQIWIGEGISRVAKRIIKNVYVIPNPSQPNTQATVYFTFRSTVVGFKHMWYSVEIWKGSTFIAKPYDNYHIYEPTFPDIDYDFSLPFTTPSELGTLTIKVILESVS